MLMHIFFYGNIQSNTGNKIGVDATLTFGPQGHLQGHKVYIVFNIILACHRRGECPAKEAYPITAKCGRPNCPSLWILASLPC